MTGPSTEIRQPPDTRGFIIHPTQAVANAIGQLENGREEPWPGNPVRQTTTVLATSRPGVIKLPLGFGSPHTSAEEGVSNGEHR